MITDVSWQRPLTYRQRVELTEARREESFRAGRWPSAKLHTLLGPVERKRFANETIARAFVDNLRVEIPDVVVTVRHPVSKLRTDQQHLTGDIPWPIHMRPRRP